MWDNGVLHSQPPPRADLRKPEEVGLAYSSVASNTPHHKGRIWPSLATIQKQKRMIYCSGAQRDLHHFVTSDSNFGETPKKCSFLGKISQTGPNKNKITLKNSFFDPKFTFRVPKSHKNPGRGFHRFWEVFPKKAFFVAPLNS